MTSAKETVVSPESTIRHLVSLGETGFAVLDALTTAVAEEKSSTLAEDRLINDIVMTRMLSPDVNVYDHLFSLNLMSLTDPVGVTAKGRAVVQLLVDEAVEILSDGSEVSDAAALYLEHIILCSKGQLTDVWMAAVLDETPESVKKLAANLLLDYKLATYEFSTGWSLVALGLLVFSKIGQQTGSED